RMAEELLSGFPIQAPVTHVYKEGLLDETDSNSIFSEFLSLQMFNGACRICHGSSDWSAETAGGDPAPIVEAALSVRVEAADHLPGLLQKVVEATEAFTPRMASAIRSLAQALGGEWDSADLLAGQARPNGYSGYPRSA